MHLLSITYPPSLRDNEGYHSESQCFTGGSLMIALTLLVQDLVSRLTTYQARGQLLSEESLMPKLLSRSVL
ncbi:hypothetical protein N7476_009005 [Penicillium atrosanguineum]|uniref:Uncharacterized protein n=1 Tax=Penicillium atrosanguineum TaxID=1132637 RepID=A0A9W9PVU6_9EURO|nr:hypothetical protein N7476_009005 [Penicillium atrosanguineum]